MRGHRAPQSGFTLIELVLVIGLFGLLSVMAYGGLRSVLTARANIEASLDRLAEAQRAYWRLREDLQQLTPRPAEMSPKGGLISVGSGLI